MLAHTDTLTYIHGHIEGMYCGEHTERVSVCVWRGMVKMRVWIMWSRVRECGFEKMVEWMMGNNALVTCGLPAKAVLVTLPSVVLLTRM